MTIITTMAGNQLEIASERNGLKNFSHCQNTKPISKLLIFVFFICLLFECPGQGLDSPNQNKWILSASFNPNYSNRIVTRDDHNIASGEIGVLGYDLVLSVAKPFNNRFSARLGIGYTRKGFSHGQLTLVDITGQLIDEFNVKALFDYLSLPISAQYTIPVGKIAPVFELGICNLFFISEKSNTHNGLVKNNKSDARRYQLSFDAGVGIMWNVNESYSLAFIPNFTYMPFTVFDVSNQTTARKLYSIGLNFLISYNLKK